MDQNGAVCVAQRVPFWVPFEGGQRVLPCQCRTRAPCRGHLWDLLLMRWESVNLVTSSTAPAAGLLGRLYFDSLIYIYIYNIICIYM